MDITNMINSLKNANKEELSSIEPVLVERTYCELSLDHLEKIIKYIERKLKWCNSRKENVMSIPDDKLSVYGAKEQGYFKGKIEAYEDLLEEIKDMTINL